MEGCSFEIADCRHFPTAVLQSGRVSSHRTTVQPNFLLVECCWILSVSEKEVVFNQQHLFDASRRIPVYGNRARVFLNAAAILQKRVRPKQLMREDDENVQLGSR